MDWRSVSYGVFLLFFFSKNVASAASDSSLKPPEIQNNLLAMLAFVSHGS